MTLLHIIKLVELYLFIVSCSVVLGGLIHTIGVFRLRKGKLVESWKSLVAFMAAVCYIITILINGFVQG